MAMVWGRAFWPGADGCESCTYTLSHGVTPGVAIFRMAPNASGRLPAETGNLVFNDGTVQVTVPDCKVNSVKSQTDERGTCWSLEIVDRRWKWRDLGVINGYYNQLDPTGKLIPWTIRSPRELALLCLEAMGEVGYSIDLPDGLTKAQGAALTRTLRAGELFPPSGTNPPINWDGECPARALQGLCDLFGRRVVYRLSTNTLAIVIPGRGSNLPSGSVARYQPGVSSAERPSRVAVLGSPTRYQMRLGLEPVGKEWDGSYRPIDELSYAPRNDPKLHEWTVTVTDAVGDQSYRLRIQIGKANDPNPVPEVEVVYVAPPGATDADVVAGLRNRINLDKRLNWAVKAAIDDDDVLRIAGTETFIRFDVSAGFVAPPTQIHCKLVQIGDSGKASWANCEPPGFQMVRETDRLSWYDAIKLAQESVWRCYRIIDKDVSVMDVNDPAQAIPINVPGYGNVVRRQQLILQDTQVEQITPQPNDPNLINAATGLPFTLNLYNGYSRDKPAAVYGSAVLLATYAYNELFDTVNTAEGGQYLAAFSVDPTEQMIVFDDYVYKLGNPPYQKPSLVLQTAVLVRDNETNQVVCDYSDAPVPRPAGITKPFVRKYPDVQQNIIGNYQGNVLVGWSKLEDDADLRRKYYLDGMLKQYPDVLAVTQEYNGFVPVDCDGAICQITWETGPEGCCTVASANSEHSLWIPPYPARRRAEGLPAYPVQRMANLSKFTDDLFRGVRSLFSG